MTALLLLLLLAGGPDCDLEARAAEWRELRQVRGHFQGGEWNDAVDRWGGRKHELMAQLAEVLGRAGTPEARVVELMGAPYRREERGASCWARARPPADTEYLLIYEWRGLHDFLYFRCAGGRVLGADWWMAYE